MDLNAFSASAVITALVFLAHLLLLKLPFVNLEFAFSCGARYFTTGTQADIDTYFRYQANPLGLPLIAFLLHKLLPFAAVEYFPRIASVLGLPLFAYAMLRLIRALDIHGVPAALILGICLLNPLIWVYSGRGTADFLPTALGVFGVSLVWGQSLSPWRVFFAGLIIGIATVVKYHAGVFLVFVVAELYLRPQVAFRVRATNAVALGITALALPIAYLLAVKSQYGFWLTPPRYQEVHQVSLENTLTNFISYAAYLILLLLPFSLVWLYRSRYLRRHVALLAVVACIAAAAGYLLVRPGGEMNFGPLDRALGPGFFGAVSIMGALLLIVVIIEAFHAGDARDPGYRYLRYTAVGILVFLAVLAISRPAQRYLIFVLPLAYLLILPTQRSKLLVWTAWVAIPVFVILDAVAVLHQHVTGAAAHELTALIRDQGLLAQTDPGAVEGHTGDQFLRYSDQPKRYVVAPGRVSGAVLTVEKSFFRVMSRSYSLVHVGKPTPR